MDYNFNLTYITMLKIIKNSLFLKSQLIILIPDVTFTIYIKNLIKNQKLPLIKEDSELGIFC